MTKETHHKVQVAGDIETVTTEPCRESELEYTRYLTHRRAAVRYGAYNMGGG